MERVEWPVGASNFKLQASSYARISHGANYLCVLTLVDCRLGGLHQTQISD